MDETTQAIIRRITVCSEDPVCLPNGEQGQVFFDTAGLTSNDLARLGAEAVGHLDEGMFDIAVGVAYRGILFAAAIAGGRPVTIFRADGELCGPELQGRRVVIVVDVVRRGRELQRAEERVQLAGGEVVGYACIVDRSGGRVGSAAKPLWSAHETVD